MLGTNMRSANEKGGDDTTGEGKLLVDGVGKQSNLCRKWTT